MFTNATFNLIMLVGEVAILYTVGRLVNQYLVYLILHASSGTAMLLHILYAPGVALHETSHAIMVTAFGGKISRFVPYHPQEDKEVGGLRLGYVEYGMPSNNPVTGFLIGIAPLVGVPLILFGLAELLVPGASFSHGLVSVVGGAFNNLAANPLSVTGLTAIIFLYLLLSGSLGLLPSVSDHRDLIPFTVILAIVLGGAYLLGGSLNFSALAPASNFLSQLMLPPAAITVLLYGSMQSKR